jgi:hypothetical protein
MNAHSLTPNQLLVLRAIARLGAATVAQLDELPELDTLGGTGSKNYVSKLAASPFCMLDTEKVTAKASKYSLTAKALRTLNAIDRTEPSHTFAQPRYPVTEGHYDGRELRPFTGRIGALAPFDSPSCENGMPVPRKRPLSLGNGPEKRA